MNTRSDTFGSTHDSDFRQSQDTQRPSAGDALKTPHDLGYRPASRWWSAWEPLCFAVVLAILMLALGGWFSQPSDNVDSAPVRHIATAPR